MIASISISSVILPIASLFIPVLKLRLDNNSTQHKNNIEEYKFIKEFTYDIQNSESIHPLVIQKGAFIIFGDYLNKDHIEHLLKLNISTHTLLKYKNARQFLRYDRINSKIRFRKEYSNRIIIRKWYYLLSFYLFFVLPPLVLLYAPNSRKSIEDIIVYGIIWIVFWISALFQSNQWVGIRNAEEIVNKSKILNQHFHM